jgi:hypothetical protein
MYAKSRTTSSIDNFYVLSVNFNKDDLLLGITNSEHATNIQTSYWLIGGAIGLIISLFTAFIFSKSYANTIEEPIGRMAKLLAVIDASYL